MSNKAQITPEQFVPAEISEFIGRGQVAAKIKSRPEDFQVEERRVTTTFALWGSPRIWQRTWVRCPSGDRPRWCDSGQAPEDHLRGGLRAGPHAGISPDRISYAG